MCITRSGHPMRLDTCVRPGAPHAPDCTPGAQPSKHARSTLFYHISQYRSLCGIVGCIQLQPLQTTTDTGCSHRLRLRNIISYIT